MINIASIQPPIPGVPPNELLKIKLEIDADPPPYAGCEVKYGLSPIPYSVRLYDLPSLFAGKIHALLCRSWGNRVKGRDFFDYVWFLEQNILVNSRHLEARLRQSGNWPKQVSLDLKHLLQMLCDRFSTVDFLQVKADILPYIKDTRAVDLWSAEFFISISNSRLRGSALA